MAKERSFCFIFPMTINHVFTHQMGVTIMMTTKQQIACTAEDGVPDDEAEQHKADDALAKHDVIDQTLTRMSQVSSIKSISLI
ncbi:hypothetical protein GCM10007047_23730 [Cerasicoccus arenae]|uniref:Uncharacterized protein n=1 Tax=Cerasicoccus arenae TaxID=424488 RepID=A0A8J3DJ90_9BACT|nr:hypothetical protein GCM10007047_23730 [Cerasicoccus arenae]